jgi:DNA-binding transcriptional MerR regulator
MIKPTQAAEILQVNDSTVRRWAARFARHLSQQTPGKSRIYTAADLDVFRRIKEFTSSGKTLAQIDDLLDFVPDDANVSTGLVPWADAIKNIEVHRAIIAKMQSQIDAQNERLEMLENWLKLPWYKRMGKPPQ